MYIYDEYDQQIVEDRVKQFRYQTRRFLAGELSESEFLPLRLTREVQQALITTRREPVVACPRRCRTRPASTHDGRASPVSSASP